MSEFWRLLRRFDIKGMLIEPTTNGFLQFFRYVFVGGIATIVDWAVLYWLTSGCGVYYLVSAVISFIAGLVTNFVLSKLFVFKANEARVNSCLEFLGYTLIGIVGLGITEIIMYFGSNRAGIHYMASKIIATAVVLAWNYIARKRIIYK